MKKKLYIFLGITVTVSFIFILVYFVNFRGTHLSDNPNDWGAFGSYLSGAFTFALFVGALLTLIFQKLSEDEKKVSEESKIYMDIGESFLEKSYNILDDCIKNHNSLSSSVIKASWHDCARFLNNADDFSQQIVNEIRKKQYNVIEEYWIVKFRYALNLSSFYVEQDEDNNMDVYTNSFFGDYNMHCDNDKFDSINEKSLKTVFKFIEKNTSNPIKDISLTKEEEKILDDKLSYQCLKYKLLKNKLLKNKKCEGESDRFVM